MRVGIVGGGWSGATCGRVLSDAGVDVELFERADVLGGHSRAETMGGVVYEPNGAHIFHTDDEEVVAFVRRFGMSRPYEHRVLTLVHPRDDDEPVLLSWPPQVDELRALPQWPHIEAELDARPAEPSGADFESFVISLMGPTLYRLFIYGYTVKQWGCEPSTLSSSFAPRRVDLRTDGYTRLFRNRHEFFEPEGFNSVIERVAAGLAIHTGVEITLADLAAEPAPFDAWVVTAALDQCVGRPGALAWRGIEMESTFFPTDDPTATVTPGYVVNHPDVRYPFTRTVESKHATGQVVAGTVVSREFPGAPRRHYPVPTVDREYERLNDQLKREITAAAPVPVHFCGRLANYQYIDQDQAIRQGLDCARAVLDGGAAG